MLNHITQLKTLSAQSALLRAANEIRKRCEQVRVYRPNSVDDMLYCRGMVGAYEKSLGIIKEELDRLDEDPISHQERDL